MSKTAFALRSEYAGDGGEGFLGASTTVGDVHLDLGELLKAGDGTIVVEDAQQGLVDALDAAPALKRTAVPEGATAVIYWSLMPRLALNDEAARRGITGYSQLSKEDLAAALQAQDAVTTEATRYVAGTAHGALRDLPAALQPGVNARELLLAPTSDPSPPEPTPTPRSGRGGKES
jgi:hypothetical protein